MNPIDQMLRDIATNESLNGWGIFIFTLITIVCTIICAGIVGLERELHGHAAGLRTHILIALGASLIMTLSIYAFPDTSNNRDPARLAAQVVSGIGFIGAGTIMQNGTGIRGLTTAASLWVCGGIGLACGSGYVMEALLVAVATSGVLILLVVIERRTSKKDPHIIMIINSTTPALHVALEIAEKYGITVSNISSSLLIYRQIDCLKMDIALKKVNQLQITTFKDELRQRINPYEIKVNSRYE